MKLAIRGHDLGKKGEFDLALCLKKYGFDGVQLVPYKAYGDVDYSPQITLERAQEISKSLADNALSVFLLGAYFNPVHSNADKVKLGVSVFERYLELANTFNAPVVGSETGSFNDDKWTYHPQNRTDGALKTVIAVGLVMGIHALIYMLANKVDFTIMDIVKYLPVSALYIISMAIGYRGLRYLDLSVASPVQNASGALVLVLCLIFFQTSLIPLELISVILITIGIFGHFS